MKYQIAKNYIETNKDIIGTVNQKGFRVSVLLIVPSDEKKQKEYINAFVNNKGIFLDVLPFINSEEEVQVWAVDIEHLNMANILFYDILVK